VPAPDESDAHESLPDVLQREVDDLHRSGVRLRFIGDRELLGNALAQRMRDAETLTAGIRPGVDGGPRLRRPVDLTQACRSLAAEAAAGTLQPSEIDESRLASRLALSGMPDPDLMIRTGGEQRISNFLLWNLAYTRCISPTSCGPSSGGQLDAPSSSSRAGSAASAHVGAGRVKANA